MTRPRQGQGRENQSPRTRDKAWNGSNWRLPSCGRERGTWRQRSTNSQPKLQHRWQTYRQQGVNRALLASLSLATVGAQQLPNGHPIPTELIVGVHFMTMNPLSSWLIAARNLMAHIERILYGYRPTIHWRYLDCNCNTNPYARGMGYYREPILGAKTERTRRIYYHKFSNAAKRINALTTMLCNIDRAPTWEGYAHSTNS